MFFAKMAEKRGISERYVRNYCAHGRIHDAQLVGKTWYIPENAQKPDRVNKKKDTLQILREQKAAKMTGGIYHKVQIDLTYNSNHIEGSRLTLDQTRYQHEGNGPGIEARQSHERQWFWAVPYLFSLQISRARKKAYHDREVVPILQAIPSLWCCK